MTATLTDRSEGTAAHKGFNLDARVGEPVNQSARPLTVGIPASSGTVTLGAERSKRASSGGGWPSDTNIIICDAPAVVVRENRERRRRTPAVHQSRARE